MANLSENFNENIPIDAKIFEPENWEFTSAKDRMFTSDHMIDAYLSGHRNALDKEKKLIFEKLLTNLKISTDSTNEIKEHLKKNNMTVVQTFLKIVSWNSFSLLFVVPEEQYLTEKIFEIYQYVEEVEEKLHSDFYNLNISICDVDEEGLNEGKVKADGYYLRLKV